MSACILYTGPLDPHGYAPPRVRRKLWEAEYGPVPRDKSGRRYDLDHLCRVRACVNPKHLEAVTHAENMRRSREDRNVCSNGHPRTPKNTLVRKARPDKREINQPRQCRVCFNEWRRKRRQSLTVRSPDNGGVDR